MLKTVNEITKRLKEDISNITSEEIVEMYEQLMAHRPFCNEKEITDILAKRMFQLLIYEKETKTN